MKTSVKPVTPNVCRNPATAVLVALLIVVFAAPVFLLHASDIQWQGGTASYNTPADWVGGSVPSSSDNAINDNGTNNDVLINIGDPDWAVNDIRAGNGAGDGAYVQNGQTVTVNGWFRLGIASGDTGIYTLNGGSINYSSSNFFVGELGTGILNVNGGAITGNGNFAVPNGGGSTTSIVNQVSGAINSGGELWVGNGSGSSSYSGSGVYNFSGGSITISNFVAIGRSGGTGTFVMTGGTFNKNNNGNFLVGTGFGATNGSSYGELDQSGGTINCQGQFLIPESSPGTGLYNLSGTGGLIVNNWIAVGRNGGNGVLNMNGGYILKTGDNSTHLDIGASSNGTLNQTNGAITNLVSDTYLGESGYGTWNLEGGVAVLEKLILCVNGNAQSLMNLDGGLLQVTGVNSTTIGISDLNLNGGTLQAAASNTNFISGLTFVLIDSGGAIIDCQGYDITIPQSIADGNSGPFTKIGSGTLTLPGANSYSGSTLVSQGKLITGTTSTASGNYTVADNAGFGVVIQGQNGQFNANNLTLGNSAAASLDYDLGNFGNPTAVPLNVNGTLTVNGTVTVNIADALPQTGEFPLIQYPSGGRAGSGNFVLGSIPVGITATILTNVAANTIDLNITSVNLPRWDGEAGGTWDIGLTTNWVNIGNNLPTYYGEGNAVLFDDNALGTTTVSVTANVNPVSVVVTNNNLSYTFAGSGRISGSTGLTKRGANTLAILNTNSYSGATVIGGGTLTVTNLANGGSPSAIGASSASPTNLVLAGGTFNYAGPAVSINRGYNMTATSVISNTGDLKLTGLAQAGAGAAFSKTGSGALTYAGSGSNVLSTTTGAFSVQVLNGTLVLDGSAGGQTNIAGGEFYVGSGTNTGANLILTNTTLACNGNGWLAIGRGNGTIGLTSSASLYNSTVICPSSGGGVSLGYANGLAGYLATQVLNLYGNSKISDAGVLNICENANAGANSTVNINDASSIAAGTVVIGGATSHGVLNLNTTGTNLLANNSGGTFRVGGNGGGSDTGVGAINQSAGLFISGSNGVYMALGVGSATAYGSYTLSGGTLTRSTGIRAGRGGLASFVQSGGTFNSGGEFSLSSTANQGNGVATFTGGSTVINSGFGFRVPEAASTAAVNIGTEAGGSASVITLFSSGFQLNLASGGNGTLNLNSGTLQLGGPVTKANATGIAVLNVNGGTLQAGANNMTLLNTSLNSLNVFKGGLTIDTLGNTATVSGNLLNTFGNGIYPAGGVLTVTNGGGAGYIGAPLVTVSGGSGSGAMAVAAISAGVVTNVVITCPGQNYVAGDVLAFAFSGGGAPTPASVFNYTLQAGDLAANSGGSVVKAGSGTLYLTGGGTYTGSTVVNSGTLSAIGTIFSPVSISSGATLAVGASSTALGTNVISGASLTFLPGSTNFMKINRATGGKDSINGMSQINYNGTLVISNQSGTLANGDSFKLFSAGIYNGNFSATNLPALGTGLAWNWNPPTGTLSVVLGVNTTPTNITFSVSGSTLSLSWPADHTGWRLLVQTNNLASGISANTNDWTTVPGSTNVDQVNLTINPALTSEFYRLVYP